MEPGVRGISNVLFHHGRVDGHAPGAVLIDRPGLLTALDRLGQQPFDAFLADPPAPAGQRIRIDRQAMLEERLAGKMLVVGVLDPAGDDRLIRQPLCMLEIQQPHRKPRLGSKPPLAGWKEPRTFPLEHLPVDQCRNLPQFMPRVDHVDKSRAQQVILFQRARAMLQGQNQNCRVWPQIIQNPAGQDEKHRNVSS